MAYKNLAGKMFGRLKCIEKVGRDPVSRTIRWLCECSCGQQLIVRSTSLLTGNTKSCGCLQRESARKVGRRKIHGLSEESNTGIYKSWAHMKQRCLNPNNKSYPRYGGRGIRICDEWMDVKNFYDWAVNNGFREGLTLERIDLDGNYEPSNCCWADRKVQNNNKSSNVLIAYRGKEKTLAQWADELGFNYGTLYSRIQGRGWDVIKAFETPVRRRSSDA